MEEEVRAEAANVACERLIYLRNFVLQQSLLQGSSVQLIDNVFAFWWEGAHKTNCLILQSVWLPCAKTLTLYWQARGKPVQIPRVCDVCGCFVPKCPRFAGKRVVSAGISVQNTAIGDGKR